MGGGSIPRLVFEEDMHYFGGAVWNSGGVGTLLRTEDGGVSWLEWSTPTNTGLNGLTWVDPNMCYVVGDDGFIAKFDRASS
jgi:photosystem II stability/assembly factor-like uncharacterized protein